MKTNILISGFLIASVLFSCKKNDTRKNSESYAAETSYPYKGIDGSRAKATFSDNGKSKTITIEANNTKYVLDFVKTTPMGDLYERNGISAESSKDSLLISQGNNVIHLGKIQ